MITKSFRASLVVMLNSLHCLDQGSTLQSYKLKNQRVIPFLLWQEMTERKEILSLKKDLLVFISSRIEAAQDLPVLLNFWTKKRLVNLAVFHFTTIWMPGLNYSISYMY